MAEQNQSLQAVARARYIRISPIKARHAIDLIRGKPVEDALAILAFTPKKSARIAEKVLKSAMANFLEREEAAEFTSDDLVVSRAYVDQGPTMKRFRARAMGRATLIKKRTSHITIEVMPAREIQRD
jgi:large subunit ribosomal protein L22